ncbi:ADP-ribose pyrophosphatase YjhB (NUDIX family) [Lysinibacillus composti]|uniref:NUDIX hydrolase n=1 Tax=Lysinibacillus composti TaxID=720633 RepID=A0A3N9UCS9_9BACI|nr:NUDIX hydrolase [Lysinibacillus composti]MBM7609230.1 ADP-ribose pyrophosphatase YjhB (NUDIX family) [Lysinibacillus composti]RQW74118.1 NUDIX hydrolase [Lysinibacillus composti]
MGRDRGKVWLGAAGVVINANGQWLVVKKRYSGLKGVWSLPAGFVKEGETADEAVVREVKEETGIECEVTGLIGLRTGVIREVISDNMAIFYCKPIDPDQKITIQESELFEAKWLSIEEIVHGGEASVMLREMASNELVKHQLFRKDDINPGEVFEYSTYRLFFNN